MGQAGVQAVEIEGSREDALGYIIHRPYWGRGFATEAATACSWAFVEGGGPFSVNFRAEERTVRHHTERGRNRSVSAAPDFLVPILERYKSEVEALFPRGVVGIYIQGSIALGAFNTRSSDIDLVTVLETEPRGETLRALSRLHAATGPLGKLARRLDALYVPRSAAGWGEPGTSMSGAPGDVEGDGQNREGWTSGDGSFERSARCAWRLLVFRDGRARGPGSLTAVSRLILRERGIVLAGEPASTVFAAPSPGALRAEMDFNLNSYWRGRAARPWLFLATEMVDFAVATLPRIVHTLETGTIISKPRAVELLAVRQPSWRALAEEVRGRMSDDDGRRRRRFGSFGRARETVRFIRETIVHANARFGLNDRVTPKECLVHGQRAGRGN